MHGIYWGYVYGIVVDTSLGIDAEVIQQKLGAKKIGTQPFFWCMHEQPVLHAMGYCKQGREPCVPSLVSAVAENLLLARRGSFFLRAQRPCTHRRADRTRRQGAACD